MSDPAENVLSGQDVSPQPVVRWSSVARYLARRTLALALTVVVTVYLTVIVVNLGGYLDEVIKGEIAMSVAMRVKDGWLAGLPAEERLAQQQAAIAAMERARGLDQPLAVRSARWLWRALTLQWSDTVVGAVGNLRGDTVSIREAIRTALPRTLLLFGSSNLAVFIAGLFAALKLSEGHGDRGERIAALLAPLSAAPPWLYGIVLTVIAFQIPVLRSLTRTTGQWPTTLTLADAPMVVRAMALPALAIISSRLLLSVNQWRSQLALHRGEDYVEMARAEGLARHRVERQYVLRPALPAVLTHLALILVALWQEVVVLEFFFRTGGVGHLLMMGLRRHEVSLVLALVVLFAYLLAGTVLLLEIAIASVDPRHSLLRPHSTAASRPGAGAAGRQRTLRDWRGLITALTEGVIRLWRTIRHPLMLPLAAGRKKGAWLVRLRRQPWALVGLGGIALLVAISLYAVIAVPYGQAIALWRGMPSVAYLMPENALPVWIDWFNAERMARNVSADSRQGEARRTESAVSDSVRQITLTFPLEFRYDRYPQDVAVYFYPQASSKPHVNLVWRRPNGEEIQLGSQSVRAEASYRASLDDRLKRRLRAERTVQALFSVPGHTGAPQPGTYELELAATLFSPEDTLEAQVLVYGEVYGLAGTDGRRRDLMTAVLWGTPIALAFGVLAALGSTLASAIIAAAAAWDGGLLDAVVQRISEINMVLPTFAVSVMVYTLYSKSFWAILSVTVALSVFGSGMRTYRAAVLEAVSSGWVEAARTQGASGTRIIWRYLLPYLAPVLVPQMVVLVPTYVFLEAALAYLGISDPALPTWGGLVREAFAGDVYGGNYHLVLVPAILMVIMALSFGLLGRSLERVLNPRMEDR